MESAQDAAKTAFEAARSGERVGVYASPKAVITGEIQSIHQGLDIEERKQIERWRSFYSIGLNFPSGGMLQIMGNADSFRGLSLDQMYVPDNASDFAVETIKPTLATSRNPVRTYFS